MLGFVYDSLKSSQDTEKWLRELPTVVVKDKYLTYKGPLAKCDGALRSDFPFPLKDDCVTLPEFEEYLIEFKNIVGTHARRMLLGAGRALGSLQLTPNQLDTTTTVDSIESTVALHVSGEHLQLLRSPLLAPKYYFASDMIKGLDLWCDFNLRKLSHRLTQLKYPHFEQYKSVLTNLKEDLTGGFQKRCTQFKANQLQKKLAEDLRVIKTIDIPTMQNLVYDSFIILATIEDTYGKKPLHKHVRGKANSCMAGIICFDTFAGRKKEWEKALWDYITSVLDAHGDHIVCEDHKTASTYGSIAKLLTPGLFQAMVVYARLYRPPGCKTFLVPAVDEAPHVSLPSSLKQWCRTHIVGDPANHPTWNQIRKLFHKELMKITTDSDKLQEIMVVLDAHSRQTMAKHYILREPADDVIIAKTLVKAVLGETVAWPTDLGKTIPMPTIDFSIVPSTIDGDDDSSESDDDECLWHFPGAEIWGKFQQCTPLLALLDAQSIDDAQAASEQPPQAIEDVPQASTDIDEPKIVSVHRVPALDVGSARRPRPNAKAKAEMEQTLKMWQAEHHLSTADLPPQKEWFHELRKQMIQARYLCDNHHELVCMHHLRRYVKSIKGDAHEPDQGDDHDGDDRLLHPI